VPVCDRQQGWEQRWQVDFRRHLAQVQARWAYAESRMAASEGGLRLYPAARAITKDEYGTGCRAADHCDAKEVFNGHDLKKPNS
jgi:hypothetical protein